jgi:phosphoribosylformylglycinamidine cyclo-ligase
MNSLPEFEWVAQMGNVNEREMARTFNLGMGMVVIVDAAASDAVTNWLGNRMNGCQVVGEVVDHGRKVTHVNPNISFDHY